MQVGSILDLAGLVVVLAIVFQLARNAKGAATLVGSVGQAFSGSLRAATGK